MTALVDNINSIFARIWMVCEAKRRANASIEGSGHYTRTDAELRNLSIQLENFKARVLYAESLIETLIDDTLLNWPQKVYDEYLAWNGHCDLLLPDSFYPASYNQIFTHHCIEESFLPEEYKISREVDFVLVTKEGCCSIAQTIAGTNGEASGNKLYELEFWGSSFLERTENLKRSLKRLSERVEDIGVPHLKHAYILWFFRGKPEGSYHYPLPVRDPRTPNYALPDPKPTMI